MLACHVTTVRNGFTLRFDADVGPEEVVAVVGPNGAGKSTLLRLLAGLEPATSGTVRVDGTLWEDAGARHRLAAERRSVGYVPQAGLLFPHLTVAENVAFGAPGERREAAVQWLERLGLSHRADARPAELSGGQAQLVAFARAQARRPRVLLLDEPLASVDVGNRASIRRILRRELRESPGYRILVTHDPLEAAALSDRVFVLEDGELVQTGTIDDLRDRPRSQYVAELIGTNFFTGEASDGSLALGNGTVLVSASSIDGPAFATIHPRAVSLYRDRPSGSPRNVWRGRIAAIEPSLERVRIHVRGPVDVVAEVTRAGGRQFTEGEEVWMSVKATEVMVYPG